jgi:uncharacterized membrane protein YdbT with pleckstrin-like domain
MGFVDQNLLPGETVAYRAKLHWVMFLPPTVFILLGLLTLLGTFKFAPELAMILMGIGTFGLLRRWIVFRTSEFAVTTRRVLIKVGFIQRHTVELLLSKVEGIGVDQDMAGRLWGYGTIIVTGTGGTHESFASIAEPLEFRRQVQERVG